MNSFITNRKLRHLIYTTLLKSSHTCSQLAVITGGNITSVKYYVHSLVIRGYVVKTSEKLNREVIYAVKEESKC